MKTQIHTLLPLGRFLPVLLLVAHTAGCVARGNAESVPDIRDTSAYIRWLSTSHSSKAAALRASLGTAAADLKKSEARAKAVGVLLEMPKVSTAAVAGNAAPLLVAWQKARAGTPNVPVFAHKLDATVHYTPEQISTLRALVLTNKPYDDLLYRAAQMPYRVFKVRSFEARLIFDAAGLLNIEAFLYAKDGNYRMSIVCVRYCAELAAQRAPRVSLRVNPDAGFRDGLLNRAIAYNVLLDSRNLLIFAGPNKEVAEAVPDIVNELASGVDFRTDLITEASRFSQFYREWRSASPSEIGDILRQDFGYEGHVSGGIILTSSERRLVGAVVDRAESEFLDNTVAILKGCAESSEKCESVTSDIESKLASSQDSTDPAFVTFQSQYVPLLSLLTQMKSITANSLIIKAAAYALEVKATTGRFPATVPVITLEHNPGVVIHYSCVNNHEFTVAATVHLSKDESQLNPSTVPDFVYKD